MRMEPTRRRDEMARGSFAAFSSDEVEPQTAMIKTSMISPYGIYCICPPNATGCSGALQSYKLLVSEP